MYSATGGEYETSTLISGCAFEKASRMGVICSSPLQERNVIVVLPSAPSSDELQPESARGTAASRAAAASRGRLFMNTPSYPGASLGVGGQLHQRAISINFRE